MIARGLVVTMAEVVVSASSSANASALAFMVPPRATNTKTPAVPVFKEGKVLSLSR